MLRLSSSLVLAVFGLAASALPAAAAILTVPSAAYPSIQSAVSVAQPGDTVLVSALPRGGVYQEAVIITTAGLHLQGLGNPVIDGTTLGTTITPFPGFSYNISPSGIDIQAPRVSVCGFTIQNFGFGDDALGPAAGIAVDPSAASPGTIVLSGDVLKNNYDGLAVNDYGALNGGYQIVGNVLTGNSHAGAETQSGAITVTGNVLSNNAGYGLIAQGVGLTITGNEIGNNGGEGVSVATANNSTRISPSNPAPATVSLNSIHDNGYVGLEEYGTVAVSSNAIVHNTVYGLEMEAADFSAISDNLVAGTVWATDASGLNNTVVSATGIFAGYTYGGVVTFSGNQIRGNQGDGIFFDSVPGTFKDNIVTGNAEIGIHVSDRNFIQVLNSGVGVKVLRNTATGNKLDARDDSLAVDTYPYGISHNDNEVFSGDGQTGYPDVWKNNLFGTADPAGLGR